MKKCWVLLCMMLLCTLTGCAKVEYLVDTVEGNYELTVTLDETKTKQALSNYNATSGNGIIGRISYEELQAMVVDLMEAYGFTVTQKGNVFHGVMPIEEDSSEESEVEVNSNFFRIQYIQRVDMDISSFKLWQGYLMLEEIFDPNQPDLEIQYRLARATGVTSNCDSVERKNMSVYMIWKMDANTLQTEMVLIQTIPNPIALYTLVGIVGLCALGIGIWVYQRKKKQSDHSVDAGYAEISNTQSLYNAPVNTDPFDGTPSDDKEDRS